jgi:OFA family oxalate/formate antiporter-like MFS transporter
MLSIFLGQNCSIPVANTFGSRKGLFLAFCLFFSALMTIIFLKSATLFFVFYAGLLSFSVGMLYMTPIKVCVNYFPERKGLVTGVILCCYGFSGIIV